MALTLLTAALGFAEFAPSIVRWLAGDDSESVAKEVIEKAKKIVKKEHIPDVMAALRENPALLIEFQKHMLELENNYALAFFRDRQSARERDAIFMQSKMRNYRGDVMVLCAALGLVFCLLALTYFAHDLPGEAVGILSTIAGIFGSCLKDAYAFEFGSSRGSKDKDSAVAALLEKGIW